VPTYPPLQTDITIDFESIWMEEADIADDLLDEFESGVERAKVERIIQIMRSSGNEELIKVRSHIQSVRRLSP
jgi:Zn-dependent M32 family carboxypeptidase